MKFKREWMYGGDKKDEDIDDYVTAYIAENGTRIECRHGFSSGSVWYEVNGKCYRTLKEAKTAVEKDAEEAKNKKLLQDDKPRMNRLEQMEKDLAKEWTEKIIDFDFGYSIRYEIVAHLDWYSSRPYYIIRRINRDGTHTDENWFSSIETCEKIINANKKNLGIA